MPWRLWLPSALSVNNRASLIKTRPIASLTCTSPIITMSTNPPSHTHLPPSLPTSPLAKRPKTEQSASMASSTKPAVSNGNAKPETAQSRAPPPPLSSSPPLLVKKLSEKAKTPTRGSAFAAGYDLYSAMAGVIPARGRGLVDTDLAVAVGEGCCESSHHIRQSHAINWSSYSTSNIFRGHGLIRGTYRRPRSPPLRPSSQAFH